VIFLVVYLLARALLGCLMVLARGEAAKDAELLVLRHENAVLRRQISRVRYQPADRLWLAALSRLIPRRRWGEVFAVTPATLLTWHRRLVTRKWDYTSRRRPGRPSTAATIRKLVIRVATDNPIRQDAGHSPDHVFEPNRSAGSLSSRCAAWAQGDQNLGVSRPRGRC
jgi:putative transposase